MKSKIADPSAAAARSSFIRIFRSTRPRRSARLTVIRMSIRACVNPVEPISAGPWSTATASSGRKGNRLYQRKIIPTPVMPCRHSSAARNAPMLAAPNRHSPRERPKYLLMTNRWFALENAVDEQDRSRIIAFHILDDGALRRGRPIDGSDNLLGVGHGKCWAKINNGTWFAVIGHVETAQIASIGQSVNRRWNGTPDRREKGLFHADSHVTSENSLPPQPRAGPPGHWRRSGANRRVHNSAPGAGRYGW